MFVEAALAGERQGCRGVRGIPPAASLLQRIKAEEPDSGKTVLTSFV